MKKILILTLTLALVFGFLAVPRTLAQTPKIAKQPLDTLGLMVEQAFSSYTRSVLPNIHGTQSVFYYVNYSSVLLPFGSVWRVIICYNPDKSFVQFSCVVIDGQENYQFSRAVLEWMAVYNNSYCGPYFTLDKNSGDITASYTIPSFLLTTKTLSWAAGIVAGTCETNCMRLFLLAKTTEMVPQEHNTEPTEPKKPPDNI